MIFTIQREECSDDQDTEACNVNTTYAYDYDGDNIKYRCEYGHKGEMDIKSGNGKLTWRLEWAARWKIFGVTCEPFGKDHAASGGSYDVSSVISEEIFNYEAPYPVPYEWITLDGEAMSKSHGVFFTPEEWLKIGPAESHRPCRTGSCASRTTSVIAGPPSWP